MNLLRQFRFAIFGLMVFLLTVTVDAQKKSYTFHGKVEQVDAKAKRLTVANEKIDGWMDAMTMAYAVDNADVLTRLKPGDQITAKVYDGDYVLHEVRVVPPGGDKKK